MVQKDMLEILRLRAGDDGDLIRDATIDRTRFSYQIVRAENGGAKTQLFHQILKEHTPRALKQRRLTSLLSHLNRNGEKSLGLVFCIYADPHGRYSTHEGTSHYLYQAMSLLEKKEIFDPDRRSPRKYRLDAYSTGKVRVFASKKPTLCPYCNSYDYTSRGATDLENEDSGEDDTAISDDSTGLKTCGHCRRQFNDSAKISPPTWDKVIK